MALKVGGSPKVVTVEFDRELVERVIAAYPGVGFEAVVVRAVKKAAGDAELQAFAAAKRAEVEAEAKRLNEEMGLA